MKLDRRSFLKTAAAGSAAASSTVAFPTILRARTVGEIPANEKINIAVVGPANRGAANLAGVASQNIIGICDVDSRYLKKAGEQFSSAKLYADFRIMFQELESQLDAVVVSTADHTHAPASAMAMRMGKHCYCEKPLAHTVKECRVLAEIAQEKKLVTQMGTQIHATDNYRRVVEAIQAGSIGKVTDVHAWCGKGWGGTGTRPTSAQKIPEYFNWDLWLGPAPERPYNACYAPANWRRWWDFGNGTLGDMACHLMDLPFWALGLRSPSTVEAEGPQPVNPEMCPAGLKVKYLFPSQSGNINLTWYDGNIKPAVLSEHGLPNWMMGVLFIGTNGMLMANYNTLQLYPQEKFSDYKAPEHSIPKSPGHYVEWFNGMRNGTPTLCNFDYSGHLSETVLLGCVAYRSGVKLEWDSETLQVKNSPEAQKLIHKEYRKGWDL